MSDLSGTGAHLRPLSLEVRGRAAPDTLAPHPRWVGLALAASVAVDPGEQRGQMGLCEIRGSTFSFAISRCYESQS
jgi:hypothetical protein